MKILFIADGRSPTAINWIRHFIERGDEVTLVSSAYSPPIHGLKAMHIVPLGLSGAEKFTSAKSYLRAPILVGVRTLVKQLLGPITVRKHAAQIRRIINDTQPDLVHAMRIPFEGMAAADAYTGIPLVISVWGNDFTLHSVSNQYMRYYTQWALRVAHGLHADCQRDIQLGIKLGFDPTKPNLVVPGSGGIRPEVFHPAQTLTSAPVVINPRGFRAYVQNEAFFKSIPIVLKEFPNAKFVCTGMSGQAQVLAWIRELGIQDSVELLENVSQSQLADRFRNAMVVVSPTTHDGTPNSLIEAMACGCFPLAGNIESIREWIVDGENGLLVDPINPAEIARGLLRALQDEGLRLRAFNLNQRTIAEKATYNESMKKVEQFYNTITRNTI